MTDTNAPTPERTDLVTDQDEWLEPHGMGRTILIGSVAGVVIAFAAVTVLARMAGVEWWSAIGLGAFVGFWGGLGFGSMVAGVMWASRPDVAAHSAGHHGTTRATTEPDPIEGSVRHAA